MHVGVGMHSSSSCSRLKSVRAIALGIWLCGPIRGKAAESFTVLPQRRYDVAAESFNQCFRRFSTVSPYFGKEKLGNMINGEDSPSTAAWCSCRRQSNIE